MFSTVHEVVSQSGLWTNSRRSSHSFLLSPSVYSISTEGKRELDVLGAALATCLLGLSNIAVIAYDPHLNYKGAWNMVRRVFSTGVPGVYKTLQGMNVRDIPRLLKVDLMVDQDGKFKIAEIDGHNKHGVGYSTLARRVREALRPEAKVLPGVVSSLSQEMSRLGHEELKLFYADQERFYVPEFEIVRSEFEKLGFGCQIIDEMKTDIANLRSGLFLDLPFLNHRTEMYNAMVPAYKDGAVKFVIPPKPFFGAKGVLAILRNDGHDEHLEAILRAFIDKGSLELVRSYIPETWLVGKQANHVDEMREHTSKKKYVLKESISSGMKGVFFSDEVEFDSAFRRAGGQNMNWVLQEEVRNQMQTFSYFEQDDCSVRTSDDWFMRVTVHYVARELADIVVTATQNRAVHGGKRCLQLGAIVE